MSRYRPMDEVFWIVVHCSATPPDDHLMLEDLRKVHMQAGSADVNYHYVIERDGQLRQGRNLDHPGNHARGYNRNSIGICMVGGRKANTTKAEDNFMPSQYLTLKVLLDGMAKTYPEAELCGHRDLDGVTHSCPSFDVKEFYYGNTKR